LQWSSSLLAALKPARVKPNRDSTSHVGGWPTQLTASAFNRILHADLLKRTFIAASDVQDRKESRLIFKTVC